MNENKNIFKGMIPPDNGLDKAWRQAEERCKNDPNLRIIPDIESGWPQVVSKEAHERYCEMWESLKPKPIPGTAKLLMFGTGGGLDNSSFEKMWKDPAK